MSDLAGPSTDPWPESWFPGRVAIVTGSSGTPGIGWSCARRLARRGARVVLNGSQAERLQDAHRRMTEEGFDAVAVLGAAQDDGTAEALVDAALERWGRIDLVVNNVGGAAGQAVPLELSRDDLVETFVRNTWSSLHLVQVAMARGLAQNEGAAVVNISSGTTHKTTSAVVAYAMAKAALNQLTRTLARDLAAQGVRVNAVAPGYTTTRATERGWRADGGAAAAAQLPLRSLVDPEDVAAATEFLLSPAARLITGVVLDVDAGNHLQGGYSPVTAQALEPSHR